MSSLADIQQVFVYPFFYFIYEYKFALFQAVADFNNLVDSKRHQEATSKLQGLKVLYIIFLSLVVETNVSS